MKKRTPKPKGTGPANFEILRHRVNGQTFTVFLCRNCTRGWWFRDPVEAWRIKNLLNHNAGHLNGIAQDAAEAVAAVREHRKSGLH